MGALPDVEIRHLAALVAVAEEGSFGRAADRLGYTQSAVSQQIAAFERALGRPLFDRPGGPRPVELTPVGRALLPHAEAVLARLACAEDDLTRLLAGESGRLSVGTFQSVSVRVLPHVVARMRVELPAVEVILDEKNDNDSLLAALREGALDLSFVVGDPADPQLEFTELLVDRFVVLTPRADGAAEGPMRCADLVDAPLIGEPLSGCQDLIDAGLRRHGVEPTYVFRTSDNSAVQAMVRSGMGLAVMPFLAVDPNDPGVVVRDLDPPIPPRVIGMAWRVDRTPVPAAARLVAIAREVCDCLDLS